MEPLADNISIKLYTDKIRLSKYTPVKPRFQWYSRTEKVDIKTGEVYPWTIEDALRRQKSAEASLSRSRRTVEEISALNDFKYFLTITFNGKYIRRNDPVAVHKAFKNIIKRLKYTYGGMEYVWTGESHRDENGIHYHIMANFATRPKVHRWKWTEAGQLLYYFTDDFKKNDCFIAVEKLRHNNVGYLTKYMTKGHQCPLPHRFGCSRGLNRSRVRDYVRCTDNWSNLSAVARHSGFTLQTETDLTTCWEYRQAADTAERGGAAPAVDLSIVDTKDEKRESLEDIFYGLITKAANMRQMKAKIYAMQTPKTPKTQESCPTLQGEQLAFALGE